MHCPDCKKEISKDSKFCEFCGKKLNKYNEKIASNINQKIWYRALKVLYILGIAIGIVISLGIAIDESEPIAFLSLGLLTLLISEILKRSFYYIYLGKMFPYKKIC